MSRGAWYVNGKWLASETTGTQRYAEEVAKRLAAGPDVITLVLPSGVSPPPWAASMAIHRSRWSGMVFEQLALPVLARRGTIINLAGPAPLLALRQVVVLFDLSWKRFPNTVSRAFRWWYAVLYATLTRKSRTRLVTISEFSRQEIGQAYGVSERDLALAACGSDHLEGMTPVRPAVADELEDGYVLCIGTLNQRKNLQAVLPRLEGARIDTVLVGSRGSARVFGADDTVDGMSGRVHAAGRLTDPEMCWLLDHAIALVFPSVYEGFGLPIVEAQARGCPVICVGDGAMAEVAADGAVYIDAEGNGVVEAVEALGDPDRRRQVIQAGRENVQRYRWHTAAEVIAAQARARA